MHDERPLYMYSESELFEELSTSRSGLTEEEVHARLVRYGRNHIEKKRSFRIAKIFLRQFHDVFVWILAVAGVLALVVGEQRDAVVIAVIIFANASMGFFQEFKTERILEKLAHYMTDRALVIRGGEKREVDAADIVPGDIVCLDAGASVPADGYLVEAYNLKINSFIFSGESMPESRRPGAMSEPVSQSDIENMLFMGEAVAAGEGLMVVVGTASHTELGRLATMTNEIVVEPTPLQKKMERFGKSVAVLAVAIGGLVLIVGHSAGLPLYHGFLLALALAVSVVPEGLPAAMSVAFALGMRRLLAKNVLAKTLSAVETLGSVSVVCTDKTGTITKNELTVQHLVLGTSSYRISGEGYVPKGSFFDGDKAINATELPGGEMLFRIGALCNDAALIEKDGAYTVLGDPTEGAILVATRKYHPAPGFFETGNHKIAENPFASERMCMSVAYKNGATISYVKGSPDTLLNLSDHWLTPDGPRPFTAADKAAVRTLRDTLSSQAFRVLAFAYRDLDGVPEAAYADEMERKLTWVGMMAMIDPPRPGTKEALAQCRAHGIRIVMMTGDYGKTALAIARMVDFFPASEEEVVIEGAAVAAMPDRELARLLKQDVIFARIAPKEKLRVATLLHQEGHVVAMTGDGVNDALALKKADIGVAMGVVGTDVSKDAADMILLDDHFASIVNGIREGRIIFANLRKFVHYVFTSNASELFTVLYGFLLGIPAPITAIQILATDLATDLFPSFALGVEPEEPDQKRKTVSNRRRGIMDGQGVRRIIVLGILMSTGAVTAFLLSLMRDGWMIGDALPIDGLSYIKASTAAYITIALTQMANLLQSRSETIPFFRMPLFSNPHVWIALGISVSLMVMFTNIPFFHFALGMEYIDAVDWSVAVIYTLLIFLYEETRKMRAHTVRTVRKKKAADTRA